MTSWRVGRTGQGLFCIPMVRKPGNLVSELAWPLGMAWSQVGCPLDDQPSAAAGILPFGVRHPPGGDGARGGLTRLSGSRSGGNHDRGDDQAAVDQPAALET